MNHFEFLQFGFSQSFLFCFYLDSIFQLFRSAPLLLLPILLPINMDLLFIQFGLFFYTYGVYLHCGYEHSFISPHNPVLQLAVSTTVLG